MSFRAAAANILRDWPLLAALGLSLLAAALRIPPLRESLWLDELHTAWCAVGPLDEVARRAAIGNQGPLFYWLEWLQISIFGESELALRLPSLVAGILLPLLLFLLARRWKADTAGLVAAGLIAVDPLSIFYSTEARPYAMVQLLTVALMAVTAQVAARPSVQLRAGWIALAALLFHCHYTTALIIATAALFLASQRILCGREFTNSWASLALDLTLVVALCGLATGNLRHIFAHRANWVFVEPFPIWHAVSWTPLPAWAWLLIIAAAVIGWQLSRKPELNQRSRPILLLLVLAWLIIPLTTTWLMTVTDFARLFFARYVAASFPAAMLLAGLCVQAIPTRWLKSLVGLAAVTIAIWNSGIIDQIRTDGRIIADRNEDWRGCVAWLNERIADDGYPVLVYSGLIEADELNQPHGELLDEYCLCPVNSLYPLDAATSDLFPLPFRNPGQLFQTAEQLILHRGGCWLVVRGNEKLANAIATQICDHIQPTSGTTNALNFKASQAQSFGQVQVLQVIDREP